MNFTNHTWCFADTKALEKISAIPFSGTETFRRPTSSCKQKPGEDRQLCNLLFCPEPDCTESFATQEGFDAHIFVGSHAWVEEQSSSDKIKRLFVGKMKFTI